ncbi:MULTISPECIES: type II secretion system minor pseudopilin GspH [Rheinheimera]|uniref:Type II secretion system protein H n=1 Tax=Rheinheimera marina TaxID=1774958 RepID=A0ABV9JGE3_9GAMM
MQKPRHQGFTLIEVMLVMVLMGLLASFVVVNFVLEPREKVLRRETERLQQLVQTVSETAVMKQMDFGLALNDKGYEFLWHDGTRWQRVTEPRFMQFHAWPEQLTAELQLDGLPFAEDSIMGQEEFREQQQQWLEQLMEQEDEAEDAAGKEGKDGKTPTKKVPDAKQKPLLPQVYILSSGDLSPFLLVLSDQTDDPSWFQSLKGEYSIPLIRTEPDTVRP